MSHYLTRFCKTHGEWDMDSDFNSECPECEALGLTELQQLRAEVAQLKGVQAELDELYAQERATCPPDVPFFTYIPQLTQRAEAAEAVLVTFKAVGAMELREQRDKAEAERDVLRKVADAATDMLKYGTHEGPCDNEDDETEACTLHLDASWARTERLRAALDAALAVQPDVCERCGGTGRQPTDSSGYTVTCLHCVKGVPPTVQPTTEGL